MAIAEKDIKLLWGRAAGRCSNPQCRTKVSDSPTNQNSYLTGEMAHIIARKISGPRAQHAAGSDGYENLILLCPNCHTKIDKAPDGVFTEELLREWKFIHESHVNKSFEIHKFDITSQLFRRISDLLVENKTVHEQYGPNSDYAKADPTSDAYKLWNAAKLEVILPNNRTICDALEINGNLVPTRAKRLVSMFVVHSKAFERHQIDRMVHYPLFPAAFADVVEELSHT